MNTDLDIATPPTWPWSSLKFTTSYLSRGTAPDYVENGEIHAVSQAANQASGLDWKRTRFHNYNGNPRYLKGYLFPNDILINSTGNGTLGRVGYFTASPDGLACVADGHISVVRADRNTTDPRYLFYWLNSTPFQNYMYAALVFGATNQIELNRERLANSPVPLPPIGEQRRIADFLDAEVEDVRKIGRLREQQVMRLGERRWSLLKDLVEHAPGEKAPLRRVLHSVTDGPFGSAFSSSDYTNSGAAVVRLGNIGFDEYRPQDQAFIPTSMFREFRRYSVNEGDILIAGLGDPRNHAGRACLAPDLGPAIVKGKCFRARAIPGKASANFITLILSSPIGATALEGRGSTRSMINLEILKSAVLPMPPYPDQVAITREMSTYWQSALAAILACDRQLAVLAERRQALITAAVTGRITV